MIVDVSAHKLGEEGMSSPRQTGHALAVISMQSKLTRLTYADCRERFESADPVDEPDAMLLASENKSESLPSTGKPISEERRDKQKHTTHMTWDLSSSPHTQGS